MPIQNRNTQKPSLKLKFVPYLAIRGEIFSMTNAELDNYISELFATNPFVEEISTASPEAEFINNIEANDEDIYEFLEHELNMFEMNETQKTISLFIIENLSSDGYFKMPISEASKKLGVKEGEVLEALKLVQNLEPAGIGARNLPECFVLQLEREGPVSPKVKHIIVSHLDEIVNGKLSKLSKHYGMSVEFLNALREKLSRLNPTPGLMMSETKEVYRIPDIVIEQDEDTFVARLNKQRDFIVNEEYMKAIKKIEDKISKEQLDSLLEKAVLAERAVREREKIILAIGEEIAKNNASYFSFKSKFPQKIALDSFKTTLRTSDSAISRIVQNKFVKTPCGTFPLRLFVKHKSMDYNDEDLKVRIREIVEKEDKSKPLSDSEIETILQKNGINIKRRTVAKYRALLKIPAAHKRHFEK
ncbi:MAG: RNA polymerase factor sigma-54 [Caldisericaceae bacterium]